MIAFNVASSGLAASMARMNASAANTANAVDSGPIGGTGNYQPLDTVQTAQPGGGVATRYAARQPSQVDSYDPASPDANADGMVATPNVDLVSESVVQLESMLTYQANASVVRASNDMARSTINLTA